MQEKLVAMSVKIYSNAKLAHSEKMKERKYKLSFN